MKCLKKICLILVFFCHKLFAQSEAKLQGQVLDYTSERPIQGVNIILRNLTDYKSYELMTDENGFFNFTIFPEKKYQIECKHNEFFSYLGDFFEVKDSIIHQKIVLNRIIVGKTFRIENVSFFLNEEEISPTSLPSLESVFELLRANPLLSVEIACHTDSRGDDEHNLVLTQIRAEKIRDFLTKKGVRADRIQAKGYGEKFLLNHCTNDVKCTNNEHLQNRRVEYTILNYK